MNDCHCQKGGISGEYAVQGIHRTLEEPEGFVKVLRDNGPVAVTQPPTIPLIESQRLFPHHHLARDSVEGQTG